MTELLEAQKEISNLRRSMNHLDITEQSGRAFNVQYPNNNSQSSSRFGAFFTFEVYNKVVLQIQQDDTKLCEQFQPRNPPL